MIQKLRLEIYRAFLVLFSKEINANVSTWDSVTSLSLSTLTAQFTAAILFQRQTICVSAAYLMNRPQLDQIRGYKPSESCWKKEKSPAAPVIGTLYAREDAQRIATNSLILLNR